eukprot:SAG11_NODE_1326_length_5196_cov_15.449676_2_plen_157_part_00
MPLPLSAVLTSLLTPYIAVSFSNSLSLCSIEISSTSLSSHRISSSVPPEKTPENWAPVRCRCGLPLMIRLWGKCARQTVIDAKQGIGRFSTWTGFCSTIPALGQVSVPQSQDFWPASSLAFDETQYFTHEMFCVYTLRIPKLRLLATLMVFYYKPG